MSHPIAAVVAAGAALLPASATTAARPAVPIVAQGVATASLSAHRLHVLHLRHLHHLHVLHVARGAATSARARVLAAARSALGRPYVYGTAGPRSFDCSGLVQWAYRAAGKSLPRSAVAQSRAGHLTRAPRPGDVLVYAGATHDAIVYAVRGGAVTDTIVARHTGTVITHQVPYAGYTVRAVLA